MNFASLDYFIMVARERSFTRAAERLYITQQTLSAHIAAIEKEVGTQLFIRRVPLELTYAGEVFLRYAVDIQQKFGSMQQELGDIAHKEKGRLRIGVAYTRGYTVMPKLIVEYRKSYPMIQIQLAEGSNVALQKKLMDGEIDLAIANFPKELPGIELEDFYQEEVLLLLPDALLEQVYGPEKEHILRELRERGDLSCLSAFPFCLGNQADIGGRIGRELLAKESYVPIVSAESDNIETLLDLCIRDCGACFCPENLVSTALTGEQMKQVHIVRFGERTKYMIRFGYRKQPYQWSMIRNFIDVAKGKAQNL